MEQIPNFITFARILSIIPICWLLWTESYHAALVLLVLAGLSDALDGYLARRYGWFTRLGAMLDPVADKLFIVSIFLLFGFQGQIPWWLVALVLGRDLVIVLGALAYRWVSGSLEMHPLKLSKLNTGLQILLLAATLLHVAVYPLPLWFTRGLQGLVALTTCLSGAVYVVLWSRAACQRRS